jgi:hypothetical protein
MAGEHAAIRAAIERKIAAIEEEEMTNYDEKYSQGDFEYKILRSNGCVFRKRAVLERVKAEEALSGWVMIEKFDNKRLRFRRPLTAQSNDGQLLPGIDPYRTQYGLSEGFKTGIAIAIIAAAVVIVAVINSGAG